MSKSCGPVCPLLLPLPGEQYTKWTLTFPWPLWIFPGDKGACSQMWWCFQGGIRGREFTCHYTRGAHMAVVFFSSLPRPRLAISALERYASHWNKREGWRLPRKQISKHIQSSLSHWVWSKLYPSQNQTAETPPRRWDFESSLGTTHVPNLLLFNLHPQPGATRCCYAPLTDVKTEAPEKLKKEIR